MNKKHVSLIYTINITVQSVFTLLMYVGAAILIGWLATSYWGAERWIYVPLILVGILLGFISMVKFVLVSMKALERLEEQHRRDRHTAEEQANKKEKREDSGEDLR